MGQAFRRATGRIRATPHLDPPSAPKAKPAADRKIDPAPVPGEHGSFDPDGMSRRDPENVLEDRDPQYDAMLSQMVGRIRAKPGGKHEMGDASLVEKYKRPLPKLRNTTPDSGRYEERAVPEGTLNIAQLRHIILLYQGKAEDHKGPMEIHQIADKFRVDVAHIERILQFVSIPPGNTNSSEQKKE